MPRCLPRHSRRADFPDCATGPVVGARPWPERNRDFTCGGAARAVRFLMHGGDRRLPAGAAHRCRRHGHGLGGGRRRRPGGCPEAPAPPHLAGPVRPRPAGARGGPAPPRARPRRRPGAGRRGRGRRGLRRDRADRRAHPRGRRRRARAVHHTRTREPRPRARRRPPRDPSGGCRAPGPEAGQRHAARHGPGAHRLRDRAGGGRHAAHPGGHGDRDARLPGPGGRRRRPTLAVVRLVGLGGGPRLRRHRPQALRDGPSGGRPEPHVAVPGGPGRCGPARRNRAVGGPATGVTPAGGWQQQSPTATRVLPQGVPPAVRTDRGAPAGWVEPGAPAAWDGDAQPVPAWATPAAPQRGVVAAVGLFVVAAAGTWPGVALLLLAALMLLSATVGYAGRAMRRARFRKGVRRGDAARAVASSPWFLVRAAVVTVLLLVLAGGSAWIALQVGGFSLTPEMLGTWREARANVLLWASAALFAVVAWFGPGSGIQREGARSVLGAVLPYPAMRVTLATLCVLLALGFVIAAMTGALPAPTWQPLPVTPTA